MIAGGKSDRDAHYLDPTLLYPITWDDKIMEDEIFGPILPILTYKSFDEAMARMAKPGRPLAGFIFSRDQKTIDRFIGQLSFGGGGVNLVNVHLFVETMPFGGTGSAGMGHYYYYSIAGYDSYEKAVRILGPETAKFVCTQFPQPPDLLVCDKKDRFFFVEVKLPTDRLNKNQIHRFREIERYLNRNVSESKKVPHLLPEGHWIEVLRLYPA